MKRDYSKNVNATKSFKSGRLFIFLAAMIAITAAGCTEYTKQAVYAYGIYESHFSNVSTNSLTLLDDFSKIENHIASLELPASPLIYTGKGKSEQKALENAEAEAKKDVDKMLAKFKKEDFEALGLDPNTYFIWGVKDMDGNYIGKFEWNIKN